MSTGLDALTKAVADLTTAVNTETANVNAATVAIANAVGQLSTSEDPQVQNLAAQIEQQVALINTANDNLSTAVGTLPAPPAPPTPPAGS